MIAPRRSPCGRYSQIMSLTGSWLVGLGTEVIALIAWTTALVIVRRRRGGSWRVLASAALALLIVGGLLDVPLAWVSRTTWETPEALSAVSLSVRLSAIGAAAELVGLALLVGAVFRGRTVSAAPRRGRDIR